MQKTNFKLYTPNINDDIVHYQNNNKDEFNLTLTDTLNYMLKDIKNIRGDKEKKDSLRIRVRTGSDTTLCKSFYYYHRIDIKSLHYHSAYVFTINPLNISIENIHLSALTTTDTKHLCSNNIINFGDFFNELFETFELLLDEDEFDTSYLHEECKICNISTVKNGGVCTFCENNSEKLENSVKKEPELPNYTGYVYVLQDEPNICKIGYSKRHPMERSKEITVNYHREFTLKGFIPSENPYFLEKKLHRQLSDFRLNGEWFKLSYEEIKEKTSLNFIDYYFK